MIEVRAQGRALERPVAPTPVSPSSGEKPGGGSADSDRTREFAAPSRADNDRTMAREAAKAYLRVATEPDEQTKAITEGMLGAYRDQKNFGARGEAVQDIEDLGAHAKFAIPALLDDIDGKNGNDRFTRLRILTKMGPEAKEALDAILKELAKEGVQPGDRRQYKTVGVVRAFTDNWRKLIPALGGFAFSGLKIDVPDPQAEGSRIQANVADFDLSLSDYLNGIPTKMYLVAVHSLQAASD